MKPDATNLICPDKRKEIERLMNQCGVRKISSRRPVDDDTKLRDLKQLKAELER